MAKLTILGTDKPRLGKEEKYSISMYGDWLHLSKNPFITPMKAPKTIWHIMVQTKTGWRRAEKNKEGLIVPYTFNQKSLTHKGIKIVVEQGENSGELIVHPQRAKEPKITKVELLDSNYKPIPKGKQISYKDTIIARAHCVEMFKMNVAFTLWEDDAQGEGHDPIKNALNKINLIPVLKPVNEKGIAEAVFRLPAYNMAVQIANARIAAGDKNEGKTHEYYVTTDIVNTKIQKASPNVNVTNPTYNPEPSKRQKTLPKNTPTQKTKPPTPPVERQRPKPDSPKFPVTSNGKSNTDKEGKILNAEFVDNEGKRLHSSKVGTTVWMKISSKNMKNKKVKVNVWEEDNFKWTNDPIFERDYELLYDDNFFWITLTNDRFKKGNDGGGDNKQQDYFIEVIHNETSVNSSVMQVSLDAEPTKIPKGKSDTVIKKAPDLKINNCGGKFCIKNGDKNELIREINIRLAGFGGNVPTDKFTDRTEKMIKQFQRDYMKVSETGKVCGNVLRAIDEFQSKFTIDFTEIKCKCKKCSGFGDGSNKEKYLKGNLEAHHRYEYPGIHRSLLSSIRIVKFYLAKDGRYSFNKVSSGYRCRFHPEYLKKPTTNHMGKALDLHFNDKNGRTRKTSDMETIRKDIFNKYLGAKWDWKERNIFNLESTDVGATTWVHYDVREFDSIYLKDIFFVKTLADLNGKNIVSLALELGFMNTCSCTGGGSAKADTKDTTKKIDSKYKWSHSEFGNMIAKKESSDDYNKCNKTKGGLKVVNDVKVTESTIKEIQQKQSDRDVFAVGRYQLIPNTMKSAVTSLGLDKNGKLNEEMQDKIFDEYLIKVKRPKIIDYLEGNGTVEDAMYSAAQEWASIGVEKGRRISDKIVKNKKGEVVSRIVRYAEGGESYYAGDGLNKAHITPEQIKNTLKNSKDANK